MSDLNLLISARYIFKGIKALHFGPAVKGDKGLRWHSPDHLSPNSLRGKAIASVFCRET